MPALSRNPGPVRRRYRPRRDAGLAAAIAGASLVALGLERSGCASGPGLFGAAILTAFPLFNRGFWGKTLGTDE